MIKVLLASLLTFVATSVSAQTYLGTDLGSFGGTYTIAKSINDAGQVVGQGYTTGDAAQHAFMYSGGTLYDLNTLGTSGNSANGINSNGAIVGTTGGASGFLYSGGITTSLTNFATPRAINSSGTVVGEDNLTLTTYSSGTVNHLPYSAGGYDINTAGTIVGTAYFSGIGGPAHAFRYSSGGGMTDLMPGTLYSTTAVAINAAGNAVGGDNGGYSAILFSGASVINLGTLGGSYAGAHDINDSDQIVGYSTTSGGQSHAFLYSSGMMADLNLMTTMPSGWTLTDAVGINNNGLIVGLGTNSGITHSFLLTPIPEPATYAMLSGVSALFLAIWHQRRRVLPTD